MGADAARILILVGSSVLGVLGTLHLAYTFAGSKLLPRDAAVADAMKGTTLMITRQTSLWDAWIGFNASHSLGAILFAVLYLLLAARNMDVLLRSKELVLVGVVICFAYLWLAHVYWFRVPFIGIAIATACFLGAAILIFI